MRHRASGCGRLGGGARRLGTLRQTGSRVLDGAIELEQAIGITLGIGEVVPALAPRLHAEVGRAVVDLERLEIREPHGEPVVLVAGLVPKPVKGGHERALAGAESVPVHDGDGRVEPHAPELHLDVTGPGLDVEQLGELGEALGCQVLAPVTVDR